MADDLDKKKWEVLKALFSIVIAQQILIAGLSTMSDLHFNMLRMIGQELGIEMPEQPPPLADPEAMAKMNQGIAELNRMFGFTEGDDA